MEGLEGSWKALKDHGRPRRTMKRRVGRMDDAQDSPTKRVRLPPPLEEARLQYIDIPYPTLCYLRCVTPLDTLTVT